MEKEVNIDEVLRPTQTRDTIEKIKNILRELGGAVSEDGEEIVKQIREIEQAYSLKVSDYHDPQERLRVGQDFFSSPELAIEVADLYRRAKELGGSKSVTA